MAGPRQIATGLSLELSTEFRLVAACCRRPVDEARDRLIRELAERADWALVSRIAARHRVEGLVWDGLKHAETRLPDAPTVAALREAAHRIARQNLLLTAESLRLRDRFAAADIPLLFLKGVTLGQLAYGSISLKMGWDIDVLIAREQVDTAADLLEQDGYSLTVPEGPSARAHLGFWHDHWKESVWVAAGGAKPVELHTGLADNSALLTGVGLSSETQDVAVAPGAALRTFATAPLFAYLCVHGASSAWFRLKWIADVAALLAPRTPETIEALYRESQALGAGRAAAQALLLCERLFETPVPPSLLAELRGDRVNRWLLVVALRKLAGRGGVRELDQTRLGTATIHLMQLGLQPGWRFKFGEIRRQLVNPYDRLAIPLPRALAFLYPLVFLLRLRRFRRARG